MGDAKHDVISDLETRFAIRTHHQLCRRRQQLGRDGDLVDGLVPKAGLGILVGDSGVGKSPFGYQLATCVASGVPFLEKKVHQGLVLVLDYENGLVQVEQMVSRIADHLGLSNPPANLLLWNFNDCESSLKGEHEARNIIREVRPSLAILDSLTGYYPEIEDKNVNATRAFQRLRESIRETGCTMLGLHNIRKPHDNPKFQPEPLEDGNLGRWFLQARGPRSLINGTDLRLGVDVPSLHRSGVDLVMRGFARITGELPLMYLGRCVNDEGDPVGYKLVTGLSLIPPDQRPYYDRFPNEFTFKLAKMIYGRGDQATRDFLEKCVNLKLLSHVHRGPYRKMSEP